MDLSVVRIHKADAPTSQRWLRSRLIVHPDQYLSQCPFVLLSEESHEPLVEFPLQSRRGVIALSLVLDGSARGTDATGADWHLARGDAELSMGGDGVLQRVAGDTGVQLLRLWINVPDSTKASGLQGTVVRHADAPRASFGEASALVYAGSLGAASAPHHGPWPLTMADLTLPAGKATELPLASSERSFVYVLRGNVEFGRNRVRLGQDSIAWIERAVGPGAIGVLPARASKEARFLLLSSPVIGEVAAAGRDCGSLEPGQWPAQTHEEA